jgi:hypothetical protein
VQRRVIVSVDAFVEIVVWMVPEPITPSAHRFKYRLAYVVDGECVLRYDNERGKGDHRHAGPAADPYDFTTPEQLVADLEVDVARWDDEHGRVRGEVPGRVARRRGRSDDDGADGT